MKCFETVRRVEFRDTDAAEMMHFSVYFTLMEQAEHAFLRALGTSVVLQDGGDTISWPRVAAKCDYQGPARFEDALSLQLSVARLGRASVTYAVRFRRDGSLLAEGQITSVRCRFRPGEKPVSEAIPEPLRRQLAEYQTSHSTS